MTPKEQAIAKIRSDMNLPALPSDWTYEQRIAYNKTLADYILSHPDEFDQTSALVASKVANQVYSPLEDTSFTSDLSIFGDELANQAIKAGESVAGVGNGVLSTFQIASWAIPVAALAVLGIALYGFYAKETKT